MWKKEETSTSQGNGMKKGSLSAFVLAAVNRLQAYLGDITGLVPHRRNETSTTGK